MENLKIKMGLVLDQTFIGVLSAFVNRALPARASYLLNECVKVLNSASESGIKTRNEVITRLGTPEFTNPEDTTPDKYNFTPENAEIVNKELFELSDLEVTLPITEKVKIHLTRLEESKIDLSVLEIHFLSNLVEFVD
jgi:hypothetical protein